MVGLLIGTISHERILLTKENAGCWTRRTAFAQVRRGSNIQLLPYPLVTPRPGEPVLDLALWPVAVGHGLLFLGEALQLYSLLNDLVDAARAAQSAERLDCGPQQVGVGRN